LPRQNSLIRQINRRLWAEHRILRVATSEPLRREVGYYYIWDARRNAVVEKEFEIEALARRLRCRQA
jgi:hypothetical protein